MDREPQRLDCCRSTFWNFTRTLLHQYRGPEGTSTSLAFSFEPLGSARIARWPCEVRAGLPDTEQEGLSVAIAFICALHMCNEHNVAERARALRDKIQVEYVSRY